MSNTTNKPTIGSLKDSIPVGRAFTPLKTMGEVNAEFRKAASKPDNGSNDILKDCLSILSNLTGGITRSFTLTDYLRRAMALELPLAESKRIFEQYVDYLIRHHKLEAMDTIYDETCYLILN